MRLKSVFISQYKNLRNFSLDFDGASFIDVFVGKNGSGKSNLFEALIEILRHLDESRTSIAAFPFDYRLTFEINGAETSIQWENSKLTVNGRARRTTANIDLPENVLIYYSGLPSDKLKMYLSKKSRPEPFLGLVPTNSDSENLFISNVQQALVKWA